VPPLALIAVLLAAAGHATWNLAAKRAAGSRYFVLLYSLGSALLWAPVIIYLALTTRLVTGPLQWIALAATGILHLGYALALQAGYRTADLSVVYPIARGSGPLLSYVGAVLLLGERSTPLALAGLSLVVIGIALVSGLFRAGQRIALSGVLWGATTGAFIAGYTVNDGWAVRALGLSPFVVDFAGNLVRIGVLAPVALLDRERVRHELRRYARPVAIVAALSSVSYLLVLFALRVAPVSRVAPTRELGTLIGAYLGVRVLNEAATAARLLGSACVVGGVICLTASG